MHARKLFGRESGGPVSVLADCTKDRMENPKGTTP